MSIKENVDYIKSELSSEEKLLEGFVKVKDFSKNTKSTYCINCSYCDWFNYLFC